MTACSFPDRLLKFETIAHWAKLFNPACKRHDILLNSEERVPGYGKLKDLSGEEKRKARKIIDEIFYNDLLKIASENEDKYGFLVFAAAKDMYAVVSEVRDNFLFKMAIGFLRFDKST